MKTHPLRSVDCQLLFENYAPLDGDTLKTLIHKTVEQCQATNMTFGLSPSSTDTDIYAVLGDLQIMVTQSIPLENKAHLDLASRDYTVQNVFPDAQETIEGCRAVTTISVRKGLFGPDNLPDGLKEMVGEDFNAFRDSRITAFAMGLVKVLAVQIALKTRCEGVFWASNGYLLPAQRFCELAIQDEPTLLYIRPHLYSPLQSVSDQRTFGMVASGAEHLIGYRVNFEPGNIPPSYMVENLMYFVAFCFRRKEVLPDGDVFGKNQGEKVRIAYEATADGEPDRIVLSVQESAELGIDGDKRPTIYHEYNEDGERQSSSVSNVDVSNLDPNDPVDAAILERLSELDSAEPADEEETGALSDQPEAPTSQEPGFAAQAQIPDPEVDQDGTVSTPPSKPAPPRMSMEELRSFALRAQVSQAGPDPKPESRSFLTRFIKRKPKG